MTPYRRLSNRLLALIVISTQLHPASTTGTSRTENGRGKRLIVKLPDNANSLRRLTISPDVLSLSNNSCLFNITSLKTLPFEILSLAGACSVDSDKLCSVLISHGFVDACELDFEVHISAQSTGGGLDTAHLNDPLLPSLYGLSQIKASEIGTDDHGNDKSSNGIDDDGNGYIDDVHGWNVLDATGRPMDDNGHGTHCAGIVGAVHNNGIGVAGVSSGVKLMALKSLDRDGFGPLSAAMEALDYALLMARRSARTAGAAKVATHRLSMSS